MAVKGIVEPSSQTWSAVVSAKAKEAEDAEVGSEPSSRKPLESRPFCQTTSGQVYPPMPSPSAETTLSVTVPVFEPFGAPK